MSAGEQIGFTVTVTNTGLGTAKGVSVTDTLPTNAGTNWTIDGAAKPWVGFWKDDTQLMGRTLGIDPRAAQPRQVALGGPPDANQGKSN